MLNVVDNNFEYWCFIMPKLSQGLVVGAHYNVKYPVFERAGVCKVVFLKGWDRGEGVHCGADKWNYIFGGESVSYVLLTGK